ncbi:MAG: hypothetical protein ACP5OA_05535 [Candidatus Woesearchaeota archaeon]
MKNKAKLQIGSMNETLTEVTALALPELLDPEITSDPIPIVIKTLQKIGGHYLMKFFNDTKSKIKTKEIKLENFNTEKPLLSFSEAIRIIEEGKIDEEKFRALKSIFFCGINKNSTELDEFWSYEFLKTVNNISGTEILILKANFDIANSAKEDVLSRIEKNDNKFNRNAWMRIIALQMNLDGHSALVSKYESNLVGLGLISSPNSDNRFSGDFVPTKYYRLTDTGYKFCEFMTKYEN